MTLQEILITFKQVCLAHVDITSFGFGETFDIATRGSVEYPHAFLEIPYLLNYDTRNSKNINLALNILLESKPDDLELDHQDISDGENIGEAIITRIQTENKELFFETVSAVSLREFSEDDVAGIRFEFLIRTGREYCNEESYAEQFKDC